MDMPSSIGEYRIMRPVAKGLMGMVYVGTRDDNVYNAIKVLDPAIAEQLPWALRFAGEIEGEHILDYKGIDTTMGDRTYFVSEYLEVKPASRARLPGKGSGDILEIFARLAETLHSVHSKGLAHGNIKASNILVRQPDSTAEPEVKISDFGITYIYDPNIIKDDKVGRVFAYMSPERIKQLMSRVKAKDALPTPPMDIYSLGVTLCEVLTGSLPYEDLETPEEIIEKKEKRQYIVVGMTSPVRRLDLGRLNEAVARSTAFDPRERFSSMIEFAQSLRDSVLKRTDMAVR